jgi:hypothetical protein
MRDHEGAIRSGETEENIKILGDMPFVIFARHSYNDQVNNMKWARHAACIKRR